MCEKEQVLVDSKQSMSWQYDLVVKANTILGCISRNNHIQMGRSNGATHSALVNPYLKYCVQFWMPQYNCDFLQTGAVQGGLLGW